MKRVNASCRCLSAAVETFLDGELEPSQMVEVEAHLAQCRCCSERVALDRTIRVSLREVVSTPTPSSLRDKVLAAMQKEAAEPAEASEAGGGSVHLLPQREAAPPPLQTRYLVPIAVAACFALLFSMKRSTLPSSDAPARSGPVVESGASVSHSQTPSNYTTASMTGLDGILEELVAHHAQPWRPEVTKADDVLYFEPDVGVPVVPPKLQPFGANLIGGRLMPLRDQRAAMLQYQMAGGHRITVYVYDPRRIRSESHTLHERIIHNAPVYVGNVRGYNVAAAEKRGVGYALATDLDERESAELVAAAAVP